MDILNGFLIYKIDPGLLFSTDVDYKIYVSKKRLYE